jgi:hypothetical protein
MKKLLGFLVALPALIFGVSALAEYDPDIASNSLAMVTSAKDNIFKIIGDNIGLITVIFVGILGIFLVMRLIRRSVGGR